jgi:zinc transport system substrate-binding protein
VKRNLSLILICVCVGLCLAGCGVDIGEINDEDKLNIVCTTFPQYDWVSNIIKGNEENVNLTLLMDKGGDLHNFQPSAFDIARVSGCDIFIYVGGESDTWVDDALKEAVNTGLTAVNMLEALEDNGSLFAEEHVEGMEASGHNHEEHEYDEAHEHEDHNEDGYEYDEHVWLSLKNAIVLNEYICHVLSEADEENAALYRKNCENYVAELEALDNEYKKTVEESLNDTLLFADRFPFRYMVEDYGLNYYAAFEGCSAETEASFNTVAFLSDKLSELGINAVAVIDGSDERLAKVIIENSDNEDREIVVFNSLQSVSKNDMEKGMTYLLAMEGNLKVLKQALN